MGFWLQVNACRPKPLDSIAVAGMWAELMSVLGYPRFGAAGGDIGSHVIGSSIRMYSAKRRDSARAAGPAGESPSGFWLFPGGIVRPPRAWLERTANVVRVTEPARGGHFAPFEEPELYAEELRVLPPLSGGGDGLRWPRLAAHAEVKPVTQQGRTITSASTSGDPPGKVG